MRNSKPLTDQTWLRAELGALRAEVPRDGAIDQAVSAMASEPATTPRSRPRTAFRIVLGLAATAVLITVVSVRPAPASAADLRRIADAVSAQRNRHTLDYRPDGHGGLTLANEIWMSGPRYTWTSFQGDGQTTGFDGRRVFVKTPSALTVDDYTPLGFPMEDIREYLKIPGGHLIEIEKGSRVGTPYDLYKLQFSNVKFDLYIEPKAGLPIRRDVKTVPGDLIEVDRYDYPTTLPDRLFQPPAKSDIPRFDYPSLRTRFAQELEKAGTTKTFGGIEVTLRAVVVGPKEVAAFWTGGIAPVGTGAGHLQVAGPQPGFGNSLPEKPDAPTTIQGRQLIGDCAWFESTASLKTPLILSVPVWKQMNSGPVLLGRVQFEVRNPIRAPDAGRVVARPVAREAAVSTGSTR